MARTIFLTKNLTKAIERIKEPSHFLWDKCIGNEVIESTVEIEIHTKDAGRLRAPLVGRRDGLILVEKQEWASDKFAPPHIKLKVVNEAEEMFEQQFGRTEYDTTYSPGHAELAKELIKLKSIGYRTRIWMLAQILNTGICPLADGKAGITFNNTFAKEILSGSDLWSNASADIIGYIEEKQAEIQQTTGIVIDTLIISPDVTPYIMKNSSVLEALKQVNANTFQVDSTTQSEKRKKYKRIAYIPSLDVTIYSYRDWVKKIGDNDEGLLVPSKTIIGLQAGSFSCHFGSLALKSEPTAKKAMKHVAKEVVRSWTTDQTEDDELQYFSAPIILPDDAQGWFTSQVLV
ncbi:MAG: major capsid protein [Fusobacteriaceae bacterium]|jgi:hypothetical protein|nr:major capsid protein [Fusobacteriaceae bacterium]